MLGPGFETRLDQKTGKCFLVKFFSSEDISYIPFYHLDWSLPFTSLYDSWPGAILGSKAKQHVPFFVEKKKREV